MTRSYQITLHARSLLRCHSEAEARRLAARFVDSGQSWKWPEPQQLELGL